jgi:Protein of unknown function (DUF429)
MGRRQLLSAAGIVLPDELAAGGAAADDVLDAAIAAWSAARKANAEAATLPADPPLHDGRPVAIWYKRSRDSVATIPPCPQEHSLPKRCGRGLGVPQGAVPAGSSSLVGVAEHVRKDNRV